MCAYGIQLQWERFSDLQYVMPLYPPMCTPNLEGCASTEVRVPGITGRLTGEISIQSLIWQTAQAAGMGYQPFSRLRNVTVQMPHRVVKQHWGFTRGQERFNFITPYYTMGSAAPDVSTGPSMITNVVRLSGMPTAQPLEDPTQGYKAVRAHTWPAKQNGTAECKKKCGCKLTLPHGMFVCVWQGEQPATPSFTYFAPNMLVLWTQSNDDPLVRLENEKHEWSTPGTSDNNAKSLRLNNHAISVQHQSFVLHTLLAVDSFWTSQKPPAHFNLNIAPADRPIVPPLTTSLLVPLAVDELWFNGERLPNTTGTCLHFPTWDPVWGAQLTVRHKNISVVTRLLLSEASPTGNIKHATARIPCTQPLKWGQYPYAVTWRVDNGTAPFGSGRLVIAHRNAGDSYNGTFTVPGCRGPARPATMESAMRCRW